MPRERTLAGANILNASGANDLTAVNARFRSDVHDIVGSSYGILVMLDDYKRIAEVTQILQGRKELVVVPLMQSDARLVENVQHSYQRRTDLRCKAYPLTFTAGERRCTP